MLFQLPTPSPRRHRMAKTLCLSSLACTRVAALFLPPRYAIQRLLVVARGSPILSRLQPPPQQRPRLQRPRLRLPSPRPAPRALHLALARSEILTKMAITRTCPHTTSQKSTPPLPARAALRLKPSPPRWPRSPTSHGLIPRTKFPLCKHIFF